MTDLEIRVFAPPATGGACPVEARLDGSAFFSGVASFDLSALRAHDGDAIAYGGLLRDALFASTPLQRAYLRASARKPVRLRLCVDAPELSELRWERLLDMEAQDVPASAQPHTPFFRYIEGDEAPTQSTDVPSILLAIASPSDLNGSLSPIDVDSEVDSLLDAWESLLKDGNLRLTVLPGRTGLSVDLRGRLDSFNPPAGIGPSSPPWCRIVDGPVSLNTLTRELQKVDGLHLIAHGNIHDSKAVLCLEAEDGTMKLAEEDALRVGLRQPRLRFAFLHSCRGAAGGTVGLGPKLIEFGVPAVIAMQDFVPMGDARRFAAVFYEALIREGAVDAAANAGRQAILRSNSKNWSIPVLFSRLKDARVWRPDPIRAAVQKLAKRYEAQPNVKQPFPLEGVMVRGGLMDLQQDSDNLSGPKLPLTEGSLQALKETAQPFVLLLGYRGRAKSARLQCLFVRAARESLDDGALTPLPLYLSNCVRDSGSTVTTIARGVAEAFRRNDVAVDGLDSANIEDALSKRAFLFLVNGEDDTGGADRADAIRTLTEFQNSSTPGHRILLTADQATFDAAPYPERAVALIIQPMTCDRVRAYLEETCCPEISRTLTRELQETGLFDLAGIPWLLSRLIENARQGGRITSHAQVFERFAREGLAKLDGSGGARSRAGHALARMAWQMQWRRQKSLNSGDVYATLAEVRGNRDFPLEQFLGDITQTALLVLNGSDDVRFAYPGLQAYFAAKHLAGLADREREQCLEDITATLGRLSRVRWWEHTLVFLAGLTDDPDGLLRKILAGSGLTEGEQILVAARCLHEARRAGQQRTAGDIGHDIVDQIVDTLVWRSRPENDRSTPARRRAIEGLGLLKEKRVIPHLVSVAIRRVRKDWEGKPSYDYSGVRQHAVQALLGMQEDTLGQVRSHPELSRNPAILHLIESWLHLDVTALGELLKTDDPGVAAVAAFALGTIKTDECLKLLVARYQTLLERPKQDDLLWAITDTFCAFDPLKVSDQTIRPLLNQPPWATYLAYLIGKLGIASAQSEEVEFLRRSLRAEDPWLQGRALRSYAALLPLQGEAGSATDLNELRELCHALVEDDFEKASGSPLIRLAPTLSPEKRDQFRYQAVEALRSIGNEQSIDILRDVRRRDDEADGQRQSPRFDLNRLSFDISEEIYWRLTGGLSAETYAPPGTRRTSSR